MPLSGATHAERLRTVTSMWKMVTRLLSKPGKVQSLPDYSYWQFRGHSWGEAIWSVLHKAPIRSFIIPERAHKLLNLWGPNGWFPGKR